MPKGTVPCFLVHGSLRLCAARGSRRLRLRTHYRCNFVVVLPIHSANEAVATSRDSRDPARIFSRVGQAIAQPLNSRIQSVVEVDESITSPELVSEFLARDHFAIRIEQQTQNTKTLFPHFDLAFELPQFSGAQIEGIGSEPGGARV